MDATKWVVTSEEWGGMDFGEKVRQTPCLITLGGSAHHVAIPCPGGYSFDSARTMRESLAILARWEKAIKFAPWAFVGFRGGAVKG